MPQPKRKHSRSRTGKRRAAGWKITRKGAVALEGDRARVLHQVDPVTGMYRGKLVLPPKVKKKKGEEGQEGAQQQ